MYTVCMKSDIYSTHCFGSCKIVALGRELVSVPEPDGTVSYQPTAETSRRAREAGLFYHHAPDKIASIVCSGGWPDLAQGMPKPADGSSEGRFQRNLLVDTMGVPDELVLWEGDSGNTFDNFKHSIKRGFLQPGEFTRDQPLVLSLSDPQTPRVAMVAQAALAVPDEALLRLRPGNFESRIVTPEVHRKEMMLAALTKLAIKQTPPDDDPIAYLDNLFNTFASNWDDREALLADAEPWHVPRIPILAYPDELPPAMASSTTLA